MHTRPALSTYEALIFVSHQVHRMDTPNAHTHIHTYAIAMIQGDLLPMLCIFVLQSEFSFFFFWSI